jgi:hypothetical protein
MTTISLNGVERRCRPLVNGRHGIGVNGKRLYRPVIRWNREAAGRNIHGSQIGQWRRATADG